MRLSWFCSKTCKDGNWPRSFSLPLSKDGVEHRHADLQLLTLAAVKFKNAVLCSAPEKCFHFNEIRCFPLLEAFLATAPSKVQVAPTSWLQTLSRLSFQVPSQQLLYIRTWTGTLTSAIPLLPRLSSAAAFFLFTVDSSLHPTEEW